MQGDTYFTAYPFDNRTLSAEPYYEDLKRKYEHRLSISDLTEAEKYLQKRCDGDRSVINMPSTKMKDVSSLNKTKTFSGSSIWIFLHDFYDAPGFKINI